MRTETGYDYRYFDLDSDTSELDDRWPGAADAARNEETPILSGRAGMANGKSKTHTPSQPT